MFFTSINGQKASEYVQQRWRIFTMPKPPIFMLAPIQNFYAYRSLFLTTVEPGYNDIG
jgi:hypothetical protein